MSNKIEGHEIWKGDLIRQEDTEPIGQMRAIEYVAARDGDEFWLFDQPGRSKFTLLNRPIERKIGDSYTNGDLDRLVYVGPSDEDDRPWLYTVHTGRFIRVPEESAQKWFRVESWAKNT